MMAVRYDIPDDFELGNVPFDPQNYVRVPDYHPLSEEEIFELLQVASREGLQIRNTIHGRLVQGIKGIVSPRVRDSILAQKEHYLSELFVAIVNEPDQYKAAAKKMFDIMNYDD